MGSDDEWWPVEDGGPFGGVGRCVGEGGAHGELPVVDTVAAATWQEYPMFTVFPKLVSDAISDTEHHVMVGDGTVGPTIQ